MFEKMAAVEKRYEEIRRRLFEPEVAADAALYRQLMQESSRIEPAVLEYKQYKAAVQAQQQAKECLDAGEEDRTLREIALEQLGQARAQAEQSAARLRALLLPHDPNDERGVVVEIRAGTGGEESALFAADLFRMYTGYAARCGWKIEVLGGTGTELGGWKEISFSLTGESVYSRMKYESGVHRVQRVPVTEAGGRIHTSAATVAVLPQAQEVEVQLRPEDLQIDTYRSSGAGGQHVNKTESAIRITHLPTGLVVECQDERSQYKNKEKALRVLCARLYQAEREKQVSQQASERRAMVGSGDRSERIRTYHFPQGRVTDHRIGLTLYRLDAVLHGDLQELTDALMTADRAQQLRQAEQEESKT